MNEDEEEEETDRCETGNRQSGVLRDYEDESSEAVSQKTVKKAGPGLSTARKGSDSLKNGNHGHTDVKFPRLRKPGSNKIKIQDQKVFVSYDGDKNEMFVRVDESGGESSSGKYGRFKQSKEFKPEKFVKKSREQEIHIDTESADSRPRNFSDGLSQNSVFSSKGTQPHFQQPEGNYHDEVVKSEIKGKPPRLKKIKLSKKYQSHNSKEQVSSDCWTSDSKQKSIKFFQENMD